MVVVWDDFGVDFCQINRPISACRYWPLAVVGEMAAPGQKRHERAITDGIVGKGSATKPFNGTGGRGCCRSGCPMATRWRCLTETPPLKRNSVAAADAKRQRWPQRLLFPRPTMMLSRGVASFIL